MADAYSLSRRAIQTLRKVVRMVLGAPQRGGGAYGLGPPRTNIPLLKGKLDGALTAGENNQTVSVWGGTPPADTGVNVTAWAWLLSSNLSSGDEVGLAFLNGRWEVLGGGGGASHTSITVVTNVQVDTSTNTIQIKTRTCEVVNPGTESSWTTIHTGTECT